MKYIEAEAVARRFLCRGAPVCAASSYRRLLVRQHRPIREEWDNPYSAGAPLLPKYDELDDAPVIMRGAQLCVMRCHKYKTPGKYGKALYQRWAALYGMPIFSKKDAKIVSSRWDRHRYKHYGTEHHKSEQRTMYRNYVKAMDEFALDKIKRKYDGKYTVLARLSKLNYEILETLDMENDDKYISATARLDVIIESPADLRRQLLDTISGVLCGSVSVPQANAIASVSAEVHKSIRQQWDMAIYATEGLEFYGEKALEDNSGVVE